MVIFLKLGGSLITDKTRPYTPRLEMLSSLANQVAEVFNEQENLRLILGHGSGSFGHQAASEFGTRSGVTGLAGWRGFAEVWYQASALNRIVVEAMRNANLPAVTVAPFSVVTAHDGRVKTWDLTPLKKALENHLLPIIHGDVVFDEIRGGTILSTEDLFSHLAQSFHPDRVLLAGHEAGVWEDFPERNHLIRDLTPQTFSRQASGLGSSNAVDVTGGMKGKVSEMLDLVQKNLGLEVYIFSGEEPGNVTNALIGDHLGTRLHC